MPSFAIVITLPDESSFEQFRHSNAISVLNGDQKHILDQKNIQVMYLIGENHKLNLYSLVPEVRAVRMLDLLLNYAIVQSEEAYGDGPIVDRIDDVVFTTYQKMESSPHLSPMIADMINYWNIKRDKMSEDSKYRFEVRSNPNSRFWINIYFDGGDDSDFYFSVDINDMYYILVSMSKTDPYYNNGYTISGKYAW